jgi:L-asparaginase
VTARRVELFTLGGTIAMAGAADVGGVVPRLAGRELLSSLPALADVDLAVHDVRAVPSAALTFADILDVVAAAGSAVSSGADGIVVTQGTDTLEETAFLVDSVWPLDAPFVLTGAMRNPTQAGADGPANVRAAVQTAADAAAARRGALVVFNDEIHAARHVRKGHSSSPATFTSPDLGPIGHVVEGVPRFLAELPIRRFVAGIDQAALDEIRVPLHTATLDDDGVLLNGVRGTCQGLVVAGFGVGHVPPDLAEGLGVLAGELPVVLASRTGGGWVYTHTYGAVGSERDLLERGLINAGFLHPYKARVLLRLLLAAGADRDEIAAAFADFA